MIKTKMIENKEIKAKNIKVFLDKKAEMKLKRKEKKINNSNDNLNVKSETNETATMQEQQGLTELKENTFLGEKKEEQQTFLELENNKIFAVHKSKIYGTVFFKNKEFNFLIKEIKSGSYRFGIKFQSFILHSSDFLILRDILNIMSKSILNSFGILINKTTQLCVESKKIEQMNLFDSFQDVFKSSLFFEKFSFVTDLKFSYDDEYKKVKLNLVSDNKNVFLEFEKQLMSISDLQYIADNFNNIVASFLR